MKLAYVLQYDTGGNKYEISGIYTSLKSAMEAVPINNWKKQDDLAIWEGYHEEGGMWSIEVHPLLD